MTEIPPPPPPPSGSYPPPPPPGAQPPYGYGGFNSSEAKNSLGVWALVLGILSIVCCGFFTGIPAILLGSNSKKAAAQGLATNGNLGQVGFILGIIGTALSVLGGAFYFVAIAAGVATA